MSKEEFKGFVQKNPKLIEYVRNNEMTWQKFYELYDLYGESGEAWDKYLKTDTTSSNLSGGIKGIMDLFKGVDLKNVQKTINSLDKAIDTFKDFGGSKEVEKIYEERPVNRYFED